MNGLVVAEEQELHAVKKCSNGRKGSRKPVHPVRGVSVLGLESLSFKLNFGTIRIDWERDDPQLLLQIADIDGSAVFEKTVKLSQLQFPD